ncbi:hypothetical protein BSL78_07318 [Apostichopus japonicus]|uniref:Uncharacterized protein n=1 Tax=Stichopus japonicus TaxID=307972 RepID=A0A2G8L692_STIJA|nr:hypothetical protein BSL78_07318 [Apostichopus japonicus]
MISQSMKCFLTIVLLYVVQAAYATKATPDRCCIQAEQFQTSFGVLETSYDQYEEGLLTCAFDFKSNQFGCDVDYGSYRYKTYLLVDKDVEYIVEEDSTCYEQWADPAPLRCVPEFSTLYGTAMNFTDSVSDPDYWFVPPASCSNATQQVPKPFLKRLNVLKRLRAATFFL